MKGTDGAILISEAGGGATTGSAVTADGATAAIP